MGASKRVAEITLQALSAENQKHEIGYGRFGNVLGSSGSVVLSLENRSKMVDHWPLPIQRSHGTLIIPEAELVIQAGAMASEGVFIGYGYTG